MGEAFITRRGGSGGSGGSELVIVGGTTRPVKPKENMIWVNTDEEITRFHLSTTKPENLTQGVVWVKIFDSSSVEIGTPLGKDFVTIMLGSTWQYVGSEWMSVEVMSFQGGVWVNWWNGYLYDNGDEYTAFTGGWIGENSNPSYTAKGTFEKLSDCLHSKNVSGGSYGMSTVDVYDMTRYSTLYVTAKVDNSNGFEISIADTFPSSTIEVAKTETPASNTVVTAKVPLDNVNGAKKIHIVGKSNSNLYLYKCWME